MEEEYIKMMSDAVDFIKETKIEATKFYNNSQMPKLGIGQVFVR